MSPDGPKYVERSGEKCPEIIVNRLKTMKRVSNTNKFTAPLHQGCNIIDTQCYHITHHSPSVFVFISSLCSPKLAGCGSSPAAWPCTHPHLSQLPLDTRIHSHRSLTDQIRTYFRNFQQNKIDTGEVVNFKTSPSATGGSLLRIERLKIAWLQPWSHIGYWKSWETKESNLAIRPTMSVDEEEWMQCR